MFVVPFCPNPDCPLHDPGNVKKQKRRQACLFPKAGTHATKTFGIVQRFRCSHCRRTFSSQTFSTHYYAKRKIHFSDLLKHLNETSGIRSTARLLNCSPATVINRISRLSRQILAAEALINQSCTLSHTITIDGFESYLNSKYHPTNFNLAVDADSQYVYAFSFTQLTRKGTMTEKQKQLAAELKKIYPAPLSYQSRQLHLLIDQINALIPTDKHKLTVATDEHLLYPEAVSHLTAIVDHLTVSSHAPRTAVNPLFSVNYLDRQLRNGMKEHVRKTICQGRSTDHQIERVVCVLFYHNYLKQFRINAAKEDRWKRHYTEAGLDQEVVRKALKGLFTRRKFLSHIWNILREFGRRAWIRATEHSVFPSRMYFPQYLQALSTEAIPIAKQLKNEAVW